MTSPKRTTKLKLALYSFFAFSVLAIGVLAGFLRNKLGEKDFGRNEQVNKANEQYAANNPYGFTDKRREKEKPKGVFRIAVLGDSFVWGDGLPYQKTWSHKLENKILSEYDSVEVQSWGVCGWSTLMEFYFFQKYGKDYDIDLLIIGWVDNDPDVGKIPLVYLEDPAKRTPLLYKLSPDLAHMVMNRSNSSNYDEWIEKIYSDSNLLSYQKVLTDFHDSLEGRHINSLVVMTPDSPYRLRTQKHFVLAKPLIVNTGFQCLDLFEPVKEQLKNRSKEDLQANATNEHPGDLMTEVFANETKAYLEKSKFLVKVHRKHQ